MKEFKIRYKYSENGNCKEQVANAKGTSAEQIRKRFESMKKGVYFVLGVQEVPVTPCNLYLPTRRIANFY